MMTSMGVLLLSLSLVCHCRWSVTALLLSSLNSLVHSLCFERK
jgi:hypothetical protein